MKSWLEIAAAAGLAGCLLSTPAHAVLGGQYSGVEADRVRLAAKLNLTSGANYTIHNLTLANGGVVREFTRADGAVFAVAWQGPGRPDLRQLLGGYFDTLQSDNAPRHGRRTRMPLAVARDDFIVQSGGHSGAFWGVAYLPKIEPTGFSLNDLK